MKHTFRMSVSTLAPLIALTASMTVRAQMDNGLQINTDADGENILGDAANEPSFAVNPLNPDEIVVGWREFPTISSDFRLAGYAWSHDGGATWMNGGVLDRPPGANDGTHQTDPVLVADRYGSVFYNSMIYRSNLDGQTVYRSDDAGVTWELPHFIFYGWADKNWYDIDNVTPAGNHYCVWGNTTIYFTRSTDEGQSWPDPIGLSTTGSHIMSGLEVGPDGALYCGWWDYRNDRIELRRSDNAYDPGVAPVFGPQVNIPLGDMTWYPPVNPDGAVNQVNLAADHSGGPRHNWLYLVASASQPGDVCDVMFARSADRGDTFSDPIRVNDDVDPDGLDYQWMAAMSVAPDGRIDVFWLDTRDDPGHLWSRLYYAYSYDGGGVWAVNRAISDPFDPAVGWPVQRKIGDYFQCHSANEGAAVVYPATFNGEQDIYFKRVHPISLDVEELFAGRNATVTATGAKPDANAWLVGSLAGEGMTYVPALDVQVRLINPRQIGMARLTDAGGAVQWTLPVPNGTQGRRIWLQVVQFANASNVETHVIQ